MGKVIIDSDKEAVPSNSTVEVIARIQIVPADAAEQASLKNEIVSKSIILLDNSGSMEGEKINQAKEAAVQYYKSLKPGNSITVATFSDVVSFLVREKPPQLNSIEDVINKIDTDGGTNMYSALTEVRRMLESNSASKQKGVAYKLVLLTDGIATDGNETQFKEIALNFQRLGVPMYIIGIGTDYNEDLLLKMYRSNEVGFFNHFTDLSEVVKQFENISMQRVLYPSRELMMKLTPGSKLTKVYKFEPQILELEPTHIADNTYVVPLGNLGTENQKVLAKMEVPARSSGEFREGVFSVELNSTTSGPMILKRSDDLISVQESISVIIQSEFAEAEMKVLAIKALDRNDREASEAGEVFTRKIQDILRNPEMTKKLGEDKMRQLEATEEIISGTKKISNEEMKEMKDQFTRRRD